MTLRDIVWKAFTLFSQAPSLQMLENPIFSSSLHNLIDLTSGLQPGDLGLDPQKIEKLRLKGRAPVLYMSIIDAANDELSKNENSDEEIPSDKDPISLNPSVDEKIRATESPFPVVEKIRTPESSLKPDPASVMTVAAFALKPGARLPIHDHPKMFGILKVIHGNLTVQAYSSVKCLSTTEGHSIPRLLAEKAQVMHVTADSDPLFLHKNSQDVHEISNDSDTVGLFIDILSPPYDFRLPDNCHTGHSHRYVTYYREVGVAPPEIMKTVVSPTDAAKKYVILEEIQCPRYYTTDHIPYEGQSLQ